MPRRSAWLFRLFRHYGRHYVARHFHAVRLSRSGYRPGLDDDGDPSRARPVVVVTNHPSWWDPMIGLVLCDLWPRRVHHAPIDAAGLAKYPFLERLGFFGIDPGTTRGGLTFLRQGLAILADPASVLWVSAQGRFSDPRERPTRLKEGVGHLAGRLDSGVIVPLALEYPFWDERTPEALARFGPPIPLVPNEARTPAEWTALIEKALQATQDTLAQEALRRDPVGFETILAGRAGVGGVYDAGRRILSALRGERFVAEHSPTRDETR
ncbi:MAG: lysophospholipid acyltransferase family protein [Isosphaeraceae bacterium]